MQAIHTLEHDVISVINDNIAYGYLSFSNTSKREGLVHSPLIASILRRVDELKLASKKLADRASRWP